MDTYLDGNKLDLPGQATACVEDILESVRQANNGTDRAICGFACDGIDVVGDDLTEMLQKPLSEFKRVDVQTGCRSTMVGEALELAQSILDETTARQEKVVALLDEGKTVDAMRILAECINAWFQLNEMIGQSLALLDGGGSPLPDEARTLAQHLEPVRAKLTEIKQAVGANDFVMLSDILEYEVAQITEGWRRAIESLRSSLGTESPS